MSLRPDLILAAPDAGPREALEQIRSTGVTVSAMPKGHGPDALLARVKLIAEVLGVPEKGEALASKLRTEIAEAEAEVAKMEGHPKVLFIIAAAGGSPQAAGRHTAADTMIALAGGENVFAAHEGYKAVSMETTAAAGPDAIAMMTHTLANMGGMDGVAKHPALRLTPAAKTGRIVTEEGGYLLGFGPRLPQAILEFARAIRGGGKS
jgi:iron complex transport system substrate-binding protein